jgi:hypothetical protein
MATLAPGKPKETVMKRYIQHWLVAFGLTVSITGAVQATVIDFEDTIGPSLFGSATPFTYAITIDGYYVTVQGGTVLTQTTNLPANQTSVYGTLDLTTPGYSNPLTVSFFDAITHAPKDISNFFLDVLNGNTVDIDYTVADNLGNSQTFSLIPNVSSGAATVGFPAAGSVVTILAGPAGPGACCGWDFFVDNIHFNEALPPGLPEPGTLALLGLGLAGLGFSRPRKRH